MESFEQGIVTKIIFYFLIISYDCVFKSGKMKIILKEQITFESWIPRNVAFYHTVYWKKFVRKSFLEILQIAENMERVSDSEKGVGNLTNEQKRYVRHTDVIRFYL